MGLTIDSGQGVDGVRRSMPVSPASLGVRLGALCLDGLLLFAGCSVLLATVGPVLNRLLGRSAGETVLGALALLTAGLGMPLYFVGQWATRGATVGMRAVGIRALRAADDGPLSLRRALARFGGCLLGIVTGMVPTLVCALATSRRRALHDLVSGTAVVRVPRDPDGVSRTWIDRYTDWGVRWRRGLYGTPHRLFAVLGFFVVIYLLPLLDSSRPVTNAQVAGRLVFTALMVGVALLAWQRARRRRSSADALPSPEGSYLASGLLASMASLSLLGAVLALAHGSAAGAVLSAYIGVLAAAGAAAALWRARALQNPGRRLSTALAEKASSYPALSPLSSGSHRVTVVLTDGRRVGRVFLIHDRVVIREGRRWRLSFQPTTVVDVVNEVRT